MKEKVLKFWFEELGPSSWYEKDPNLDKRIKELFLETYNQATRGELFSWRDTIEGRLAEIIVLDQFSRNIFRDDPRAFQYDCIALTLAQEASQLETAQELTDSEKAFLYMPLIHSESKAIHEKAIKLYSAPGLEKNLEFEHKHKNIIDRFGRYPHRNEILGRTSTPEEIEFLKAPDSFF